MNDKTTDLQAELQHRIDFERLVSVVASNLTELSAENLDTRLQTVLRAIGEFSDVERCALFRLSPQGEVMSNTHEWFAPGIPPFGLRLRALPVEDYPWWMEGLRRGGIRIDDARRLPLEAAAERELLEKLRIRSAIVVPLNWRGALQGYLGLSLFRDTSAWSEGDLRLLRVIARLLSLALSQFEAAEALRHKEALLEGAERVAHIGSWSWDPESGRVAWSRELYAINGLRPEDVVLSPETALAPIHPADRDASRQTLIEHLARREPLDLSLRIVRPNGEIRYVRIRASPHPDEGMPPGGFVGTVQDITEIHLARTALENVNRILRAVSEGNAALVRATDEDLLLQELCRVLVDVGGYRLAWFAVISGGELESLRVAASYGTARHAFFSNMRALARSGGDSPFIRALQSGKPVRMAALDELPEPGGGYWRAEGLASAAAFPLFFDRVAGSLEVESEHTDAFDPETFKILSEFAVDIAFAVGALRARRERDETQRSLEASERSLRAVLERESDGIVVMDHSARILFANPAAQAMMGRRMEQLAGTEFAFPVVSGESAEITLMRPDGSLTVAEMRSSETEWYKIPSLVLAIRDVTEQRRAEAQLRIWATVLDRSGELIFVTDADKRIIAVNRAFEALTGYLEPEALGKDPGFLSSDPQETAFYQRMWATIDEVGHWQGEVEQRRKDGQILPLWLAITAASDKQGVIQHFIGIGSDISERKEAESRIHFLAYHDALTGLPNRVLFRDRLELALAHAKRQGVRVAVLFLDLDRFKNINDSLGHHVGDELLKQVAMRVTHCIRADDTLSRQGGDEFLVLLYQLYEPDDAAQVAAKILNELTSPFLIGDLELHVSGSIGIAVYPDDGRDVDTLVRNADAAMYYAKELGRNNFQYFVADLNARVSARLILENALRRAVDRGELLLYYQPQINARTGTVVGVEALLRWNREGSLMEPNQFIGLAEETELIIPMGEWVLREACRQQAAWQAEGLPCTRIAVNLSAIQFQQKGAFERLRQTLKTSCAKPRCIEMELTEGTLMRDAETSLRYLKILKELGVSLAIDDFGTGYSSLNYLFRFPVDRLKVDQSFVRDLPGVAADRAVTQAIIALARSLRLSVVAEGVETAEELKLLLGLHCDEFQGFYFAPPLPADAFAAWWAARLSV